MATQSYQVKKGDTLSGIASQHGVNVGDISGYKSGDPNKIFEGENLSFSTREMPPANTINAANLGQQPYSTPPVVPKTGYQGLIESTNAVISQVQPDVDKGATDIKNVYDKLGGQSTRKTDLYDSEGVYEKQKAYNSIVNTMNAKDLAYRRKTEAIRNENPTGQLESGQQIAIEKIDREWASEKADLAISAAFARDDYDLAKTIVDDKIAAETEGLTTELAGLEFFYTQNYNRLSDAQKTLLAQQTQQVTQELEEKKALLADVSKVQLAAAQNGAPASIIVAIGKAQDVGSAIAASGGFLNDKTGGGSSGVTFSDTQVANGAAAAGVPLSTFQGFDEDTKNFFINGDISGAQSSIDAAFSDEGASLSEVQSSIKEMGLPAQGEQFLLQYAEKSAKANSYTLDDFASDAESSFLQQLNAGKSRAAAWDSVFKDFNEEAPITAEEKKKMTEVVDKVYGQRTWLSKILPGGN